MVWRPGVINSVRICKPGGITLDRYETQLELFRLGSQGDMDLTMHRFWGPGGLNSVRMRRPGGGNLVGVQLQLASCW